MPVHSSRDDILSLLAGRRVDRLPVFGGLPSLTRGGLAAVGVAYVDAHQRADLMARAAASTAETHGYEAAVVPHDMCVEAEALGAGVDFHGEAGGFGAPLVAAPLAPYVVPLLLQAPGEIAAKGRVPLVLEALRLLKAGAGQRVAVGAWVPGPFTLGWQLYGTEGWMEVVTSPEVLEPRLSLLGEALVHVATAYREAGADFLTVHDMGGSPQVIGPRTFRRWVKPALRAFVTALPAPVVLSVCGDTNAVVEDLAEVGAAALNVDHRNDLARTRQRLGPGAVLLGNYDPVGVLSQGSPESVAAAVRAIADAGTDAVWPGCDLWPDIPDANLRALVETARACVPWHVGGSAD
jgi:[methyl-Co(III) methanol-specific corrinoid protein]:coenzyme M methyltransferase